VLSRMPVKLAPGPTPIGVPPLGRGPRLGAAPGPASIPHAPQNAGTEPPRAAGAEGDPAGHRRDSYTTIETSAEHTAIPDPEPTAGPLPIGRTTSAVGPSGWTRPDGRRTLQLVLATLWLIDGLITMGFMLIVML